jgi:hypothetical protein
MLGILKKTMTPAELGYGIVHVSEEILFMDSARSLATRFDGYFGDPDPSGGFMSKFLERKRVSDTVSGLHHLLFTHCAIQAACTQFDEGMRKAITHGAMQSFMNPPDSYDPGRTYTALESAYSGKYRFDRRVEPLSNSDAKFTSLPNPNIGVINAKYLIESFVIPNVKNSQAFIDDFKGYSATAFAAVATVCRAIDYILTSFEIS